MKTMGMRDCDMGYWYGKRVGEKELSLIQHYPTTGLTTTNPLRMRRLK